MNPEQHFYRTARCGLLGFLVAGIIPAALFFSRSPEGQFHLVQWARALGALGCPEGIAHFLLWLLALIFMGGVAFAAAVVYCRRVPTRCPQCGGPAYLQSAGNWAYRCRECHHFLETNFGEEK